MSRVWGEVSGVHMARATTTYDFEVTYMESTQQAFRRANEQVRQNLPREHGFEPAVRIDGTIPAWLGGTLYRNGPALIERFGQAYGHAFEGDGAVTAVRVSGETQHASFASRLVRTPKFLEEERQGRLLHGMGVSWFRRMRNVYTKASKNPANVNVMRWQDRLYAVPEGSPPYEIDADTLETHAQPDLGEWSSGYHSAHPHRVESRRATFSYKIDWGKDTTLSVMCYPDDGKAFELTRFALPGAVYFHDFVATHDHLIFFVPPVRVNIFRAMTRIKPFRKLFRWEPNLGTYIYVVPLDESHDVVELHTDPMYVWHFANAFAHGGSISVDLSYWEDFSSFDAVGDTQYETTSTPSLRRATLDLGTREVAWETCTDALVEFPSVVDAEQGEPTSRVFSQTEGEHLGGVMRFDLDSAHEDTFMLEPGQIASEPNFVPRPGGRPHEGVVSMLCYDLSTHTSFLALFDAEHISDGPIARIWCEHHIPMTFHGLWVC